MSKIIIIEGNSNDKDNARVYMVKGEKGDSAYDVYVKNGGTLTEEEWLDAFLNANNYYSKSEVKGLVINNLTSDTTDQPLSAKQGKVLKGLVDNCVVKDNIAVITGTLTIDSNHAGIDTVAYPTGFTSSNTYIVCAYCNPYASFDPSTLIPMPSFTIDNNTIVGAVSCMVSSESISVYATGSSFAENQEIPYKLVLMKIS